MSRSTRQHRQLCWSHGRGIALQFRDGFPDNFKAYAKACQREEVQPGKLFVFETGRFKPAVHR